MWDVRSTIEVFFGFQLLEKLKDIGVGGLEAWRVVRPQPGGVERGLLVCMPAPMRHAYLVPPGPQRRNQEALRHAIQLRADLQEMQAQGEGWLRLRKLFSVTERMMPFGLFEAYEGAGLRELLEAALHQGITCPAPVATGIVSRWLRTLTARPDTPLASTNKVLVGWSGEVKVLGRFTHLERLEDEDGGQVLERHLYAIPDPSGATGARRDVFRAGALLFLLLTGRYVFPAWRGEDPALSQWDAVAADYLARGPEAPGTLRTGLDGRLEQLVLRALAVHPEARYPDVRTLLSALQDFDESREPAQVDEEIGAFVRQVLPQQWALEQRMQTLFAQWQEEALEARATGGDNREMVLILGGPFFDETAQREKATPTFYMDRNLVTNEAYRRFLHETGHPPPADWKGRGLQPFAPVTGVSHADACAYARWANKRLPSNEEWERAARRDGRLFPWGDDFIPTYDAGLWRKPPALRKYPKIGTFGKGTDTDFDLEDLGLVWEWTETPKDKGHLIRGGPWRDRRDPPTLANLQTETHTGVDVGFRCVAEVQQVTQQTDQEEPLNRWKEALEGALFLD